MWLDLTTSGSEPRSVTPRSEKVHTIRVMSVIARTSTVKVTKRVSCLASNTLWLISAGE